MKKHLLVIFVLTCVSAGEIQDAIETAIRNSQQLGGNEVIWGTYDKRRNI